MEKKEKSISNVENKIPVLYIAGTGRNGSTLMERVLNEIPSFFTAGELGQGWVFYKEKHCLCGKQFDECPVWESIVKEVARRKVEPGSIIEANNKYNKKGTITTFLKLLRLKKKQALPDDFKQYLKGLQILYSVIAKKRNCKIMTDSTPLALYGYYLSLVPSIDLYVVHLVIDPRGFAHSGSKIKFASGNVPWSPKIHPFRSAFSWLKRNWFIERVLSRKKGRYLRVHYEDFIENPIQTLKEIGALLGIKLEPNDLIKNNTIHLGENHFSAGNIDAITKQGKIVLKLDERWKRDMKWWNIVLVTLITWPLFLKYFIVDKMMKKKHVK